MGKRVIFNNADFSINPAAQIVTDNSGLDYTIIEYINTNSGFINSGYKVGNDLQYKFKTITPASSISSYTFSYCGGTRSGFTNPYNYSVQFQRGSIHFRYYDDTAAGTVEPNTIYEFYADKNKLYVNGVLKATSSNTTDYTAVNFYIGKLYNQSGAAQDFRLYYFQLWKNDALVRDYVAVQRVSDGVYGLFDKVSNTFYASADADHPFKR